MSVKPNFLELTLRSNKNLKSQSIVESRIAEKDSDIVKIITVSSNATIIGSETVAGEVRYSGRTIFNLVYENSENQIIKSEYGVEFSHKAENDDILASMTADVYVQTENTELKQLNGNFVLSTIATANITLSENTSYNYLSSGDGFISKSDDYPVIKSTGLFKGGYEVFEEIENESLNDILSHNESVVLTDVQAGIGCIICDGTINLNLLYTKGDETTEIKSLSKLIDFRYEIEAEQAMPEMTVSAFAYIKGAKLNVTVDESKNISIIEAEISVETNAEVFESVIVNCVSDLYSTDNEINISAECIKSEKPAVSKVFSEKVSGSAILSSEIKFSTDIESITQETLNVQTTSVTNGKVTAEGVVSALALTKNEESGLGSVTIELPFTLELELSEVNDKSRVVINGISHNITAKQKKEGEIEMEAQLKLYARVYDYDYITVISDINEGDEIIKKNSAISVFIPEKNDELWDVAKRLKEDPENIILYNSDLEFPLQGDEKIIIYRQKILDY